MRASNDESSNQTVSDALTGISTSSNGSVHCAGFSAHHDSDIATANKFTAHESDLSSFGHGVGCLDGGHHTTGFDHAKGNSRHGT